MRLFFKERCEKGNPVVRRETQSYGSLRMRDGRATEQGGDFGKAP